jgi:hypothetical protein
MWRDYKITESIQTRPKMALATQFNATVHSIYFYSGVMLVHSGTKLYKVTSGTVADFNVTLEDGNSNGFIYGDKFYIMDGKRYLVYDGSEIKNVEGYVPTTSIKRRPQGGGETLHEVNMLSDYRINTFLGDGVSTDFYLDYIEIDEELPEVTVFDSDVEYTVSCDYEAGKVTITPAPPEPLTGGQDNVKIKYKKVAKNSEGKTYRDVILKCTITQIFDNRVFFSGNPDYPNYLWYCELDEPSYVGDLNYSEDGMDSASIRGMVAGNNTLWVFREPSDSNTNVFYHVPSQDYTYGKVYPRSHSSVSLGCKGKAINFGDDIVFFSQRGMEGVNGDINTEQFLAHRSSMVDSKLLAEANYGNMLLEEWEGYLLVFIDNKCYLADSRAVFTNENHTEYEWFYWEFDKAITCTKVNDGILYMGTSDGVYTLSDNGDVYSYWTTPKDKFYAPSMLKTTNKKGCVVEAKGNVALSVKTDDETAFGVSDVHTDISDYFVSRIKKKKFKDIQLKFESVKPTGENPSAQRFSLEQATLECFIGGYIKGR